MKTLQIMLFVYPFFQFSILKPRENQCELNILGFYIALHKSSFEWYEKKNGHPELYACWKFAVQYAMNIRLWGEQLGTIDGFFTCLQEAAVSIQTFEFLSKINYFTD